MTSHPRASHPTARAAFGVLPGVLLVVLPVVLLVVLTACGGPRGVSLTELAVNSEFYDGKDVVASGVVREFGVDDDGIEHHFVLQDAEVNRVQLLPADVAAPHTGSAVEVVGEFAYDEDRGRRLHIDTIEAVQVSR